MLKPKTSADVYLEEAEDYLSKGEVVQACEKYYKAAEEAILILANKYKISNINEKDEASLERIVSLLSKILGETIVKYWATAVLLLTAKDYMDQELVKIYKNDVERLVFIADNEGVNT
ncbi:PaREP1 family protein [Acidianus sp.]|uniref:PaREP1 family protein n=1 Tax=Acidianus sp. TaxID=1872104 RepID=UPI00397A8A8C